MFGISFTELLVIMVVALLVFGPEKLPEIASQLGKLSSQLKRASDGFRREFYNSVYTPAQEQTNLFSSELLTTRKELLTLRSEAPKPESDSTLLDQEISEAPALDNKPAKDLETAGETKDK